MSETAVEDIAWARKSYHAGRSIDFIASVLGMKPRAAFKLIRAAAKPELKITVTEPRAVSPARQAAEQAFAKTVEPKRPTAPYERKLDQYRIEDEEGVFIDKPQTPSDRKARAEEMASAIRRRRRLRRFFAKHWDMIWFLRRCGMSGRTLREIYGAELLIWSVGGGIDPEIF